MMKRKLTWTALLGGLLLSGLVGLPALALDSQPVWSPREAVSYHADRSQLHGSDRHLAFNHHGEPAVSFGSDSTDILYLYHRIIGQCWAYSGGYGGAAVSPTLVFDRHERPALGYVDGTDLKHSHWNGTAWQTEKVMSDVGGYASMALDAYGRPAFAYTRASSPGLQFIWDTDGDGDWADETPAVLSTAYDDFASVRLVFDALNRPWVAFVRMDKVSQWGISMATQDWGHWSAKQLVAGAGAAYTISMDLDPDTGAPGLAAGDSAGNLLYLEWYESGYQLAILGQGLEPSLAYDPADGRPAIAYRPLAGGLHLKYDDGTGWQDDVVDSTTNLGYSPSLAFNPYGDDPMAIAYYDSDGDGLYYRQDPPVVPEPATVGLVLLGCAAVMARRRISRRKS